MLLADHQIRKEGLITPFDESLLQPASYDLRLGAKGLSPRRGGRLVVGKEQPEYIEIEMDGYALTPHEFILCSTVETLVLPANIAGKYEGKSSLGRLGLMTHITAGFIDPGFRGNLTLEIKNAGPHLLVLSEGMAIGQVAFYYLAEEAERMYGSAALGSRYQDSVGAVGYRLST